ncbi:type IV secretion system protein [Polaromonas sp. JS666]|uniref:type IV secretion system protein n=1 Tax=Polaromonas sp. (strain JS666 / ATCC BAA-500) TaxID=296591 RepID=UPI000053510A|nr:type IV secretion system protein [Polaromonas sp. JS666]ABE47317.1 hypothetical protein Bpro_5463 [Polaromonas sp. JS666]
MTLLKTPAFRVLLVVIALFFTATWHVLAQGNNPYCDQLGVCTNQTEKVEEQDPGVAAVMVKNAIAAFTNVLKIANDSINSIRSNSTLLQYGQRLTVMLTGIVILWGIGKNIALKQSLPQLLGDLVFPLIIASFVLGAGLEKLPGVIESSVTKIAGIFGAGTTSSLETSLATNLLEAAARVWNAERASSGVLEMATSPLMTVALLILRIAVILLILVAAGLGVAAILVAKFQLALAIALAPLLIPWIVFKPTEFLFSGWLSFFLKAGFGLVGVFAVSAVVVQGSQNMSNLITTVKADSSGVMTLGVMAAMSIIFTYLMLKGSDIGEGIISGNATGIGQLSSVAKGAAAMSPVRMASATAGLAGSAAKMGGAGLAGKLMKGRELSGAGKQLAQKAFGNGTASRAVFEKTRTAAPPKVDKQ